MSQCRSSNHICHVAVCFFPFDALCRKDLSFRSLNYLMLNLFFFFSSAFLFRAHSPSASSRIARYLWRICLLSSGSCRPIISESSSPFSERAEGTGTMAGEITLPEQWRKTLFIVCFGTFVWQMRSCVDKRKVRTTNKISLLLQLLLHCGTNAHRASGLSSSGAFLHDGVTSPVVKVELQTLTRFG